MLNMTMKQDKSNCKLQHQITACDLIYSLHAIANIK